MKLKIICCPIYCNYFVEFYNSCAFIHQDVSLISSQIINYYFKICFLFTFQTTHCIIALLKNYTINIDGLYWQK